jgi:drug/metabolite transporter (DMT)-like permease
MYQPLISKAAPSSPKSNYGGIIVCIAVCAQFTSYSIARAMLSTKTCDVVTLTYSEAAKALVSLACSKWNGSKILVPSEAVAVVPAAIAFGVMNVISFWALRRVTPTLFAVIMQFKLVTTTAMSICFLGRRISPMRVRC